MSAALFITTTALGRAQSESIPLDQPGAVATKKMVILLREAGCE